VTGAGAGVDREISVSHLMTFAILGPLEVSVGGRRLSVSRSAAALLALLLIHANRAVRRDWIIDALWGGDNAAGATKRLHVAVARLRRILTDADADADADAGVGVGDERRLQTVAGGYRLGVGEEGLDTAVFEARLEEGLHALANGDLRTAAGVLRDTGAVRGAPLADVGCADCAQPEIQRLTELRLTALEARVDADLRLGRHVELVDELQVPTGEHPNRERLTGLLMLALYRSGRPAERSRRSIARASTSTRTSGLEPGAELVQLQLAGVGVDGGDRQTVPAVPCRRPTYKQSMPTNSPGRGLLEFPRFRGHLIAGPSGPAVRIGVHAVNPAVFA
jgi:DNA-binding SARP family transcriptional activator